LGIEQEKPNDTPPYTQSGHGLNSLDGSSMVFFEFGKKCTQKTDSLFLRAGKKVSKKTVPLVLALESYRITEEQVWN